MTQPVGRLAALIAVPLAWGTYGPAVKLAYELPHVPPAPVLQASFQAVSFGGLLLAGVLRARDAARDASSELDADDASAAILDGRTLRAGAELGTWLFLGQAVQLQGLQRTNAARAGFLVQLTTLFVPLVEALLLRRALPPKLWAACGSATAGLALISAEPLLAAGGAADGGGGGMLGATLVGDALMASSALLYTTHVVRLGEYASELAPLPLARAKAGSQLALCIGTLVALSSIGSVDVGEWAGSVTPDELTILFAVALWNGLIPSAFTTWAQTYGQAAVPPSAANVLYSFQPVWNAALASLVLGEQLSSFEIAGGACIVLGAVLAADATGAEGEQGEA